MQAEIMMTPCGTALSAASCLAQSEDTGRGVRPCVWDRNVMQGWECRGDFAPVRVLIGGTLHDADPAPTLDDAHAFCAETMRCRYAVVARRRRDTAVVRWWAEGSGVDVIIQQDVARGPRLARLAAARNQLLEIWASTDDEVLVMADLDGPATFRPHAPLRAALRLPAWDALSFWSAHYYDLWALRCDGKRDNCWASRPHTCRWCLYPCLHARPAEGELRPVESAFNGLAFYRRTALACRYVHDGDCEHVQFHRCMRSHNLAVRLSSVAHEVNATPVRAHLDVGAC